MLTRFADVFLSEGYGSRLGYSFNDFRQGNPRVYQTDQKDAFQKDYVIMLRSPNNDEYELLKPGACLISMIHYPTRPQRVKILNELGINSISLDSIVDDHNLRLVENMRAVAWNGLEISFDLLEKIWPGLQRGIGKPFHVLILGTGMVGKYAVEAATKFGNIEPGTPAKSRIMGQDRSPSVLDEAAPEVRARPDDDEVAGGDADLQVWFAKTQRACVSNTLGDVGVGARLRHIRPARPRQHDGTSNVGVDPATATRGVP